MIRYLLIITTLIVISCSENKNTTVEKQAPKSDTLLKADKRDTVKTDTSHKEKSDSLTFREYRMYYKKIVEPVTFSKLSILYSQPDTLSEIIKFIPFNSSVKPIEDQEVNYWIEVEYENNRGFLKSGDVAQYSFISLSQDRRFKYFIIPDGKENYNVTIYKYDLSNKKMIDSFNLENYNPDYVSQINTSKWKNTDVLLCLNSSGNCCGCSTNQVYIIDANNKFEILLRTTQYIDDDPDVDSGFETWVTFPMDPQSESIIFNEHEYGALLDKNDKVKLNKKGEIISGTLKDSNKYYHWNGYKLVELSVTDNKK